MRYNDRMSEIFYPKAYQAYGPHTSNLTRVLKSLPTAVAIEALNGINWLEPVGHLDHIWSEAGVARGTADWVHPLTAVLWVENEALSLAAIERAHTTVKELKERSVYLSTGKKDLHIDDWAASHVVHQALQYGTLPVIEKVLDCFSQQPGRRYLQTRDRNENVLIGMARYGRRDRTVEDWQRIIQCVDRHVMAEGRAGIAMKPPKKGMMPWEKQHREENHNRILEGALEYGNHVLVDAVLGLNHVTMTLDEALESALSEDNASGALKILNSPLANNATEGTDEHLAQTKDRLARQLGKAFSSWHEKEPRVPDVYDLATIQAHEWRALNQVMEAFVVRLGQTPDQEGAGKDREYNLLPWLNTLSAEDVARLGSAWVGQGGSKSSSLPTFSAWNTMTDGPWKAQRTEDIRQAMQTPERYKLFTDRIRNNMEGVEDWRGEEGQHAMEMIQVIFGQALDPLRAAQAWWDSKPDPKAGTEQDKVRREAWLNLFLPQPARPRPKSRF